MLYSAGNGASVPEGPVGYLIGPSDNFTYLLLGRQEWRDVLMTGQNLVVARYTGRRPSGKDVPVETLARILRLRVESPYLTDPLALMLFQRYGPISNRHNWGDVFYIEVEPIVVVNHETGESLEPSLPPTHCPFYLLVGDGREEGLVYYRREANVFYLGRFYGSSLPFGVVVKHFGEGGWGDARMIGVAGQTGSGKTILMATLTGAYAAHPELGILIIDPQGQFSACDPQGRYTGEMSKDPSQWSWQLGKFFEAVGRCPEIIRFSQICLPPQLDVFLDMLRHYEKPNFWENIRQGMNPSKMAIAEGYLTDYLTQKGNWRWEQGTWQAVVEAIARSYRNPDEEREKIEERTGEAFLAGQTYWNQVRQYFDPQKRPYQLQEILERVLTQRAIIILFNDIQLDNNYDRDLKDYLTDIYLWQLFRILGQKAQSLYRQAVHSGCQSPANALIVLDEAQRLVPAHPERERQRDIAGLIKDAVNTSRKLGVGWLLGTQSVANLDQAVWKQLGTTFIGYGFGRGADKQWLMEIIGRDKTVLDTYMAMPQPLRSGIYWFLVRGEIVALGNGQRPFFLRCFSNQQELLTANQQFLHR